MKLFFPIPLVPSKSFADLVGLPEYHNWGGVSWLGEDHVKYIPDAMNIAPSVPEASTWLMMIVGIVVVGIWKRCR